MRAQIAHPREVRRWSPSTLKRGGIKRPNELADGDGASYRHHLKDDAIVVVPGEAMSKQDTVISRRL